MKKHWWLIIIAVIILTSAGYTYKQKQKKPLEVSAVETERGDVKVTVSATETGTIKATNEVLVVPRVSGELVWLGVEEGDHVTAGQVIARLDSKETEEQVRAAEARLQGMDAQLRQAEISSQAQPAIEAASIKQAETALQSAKTNLSIVRRGARPEEIATAQAGVDEANVSVDNAKRDLDRKKGLLKQGFVPESAVDTAQATYDMALARQKSAQESLNMIRTQVRSEDVTYAEQQVAQATSRLAETKASAIQSKTFVQNVRVLKSQVTQSRADLDQVRTRLAYLTIRAPISGLVTRVNSKEGEFILGGTSLGLQAEQIAMMKIADMQDLWVEAAINEADVAKVALDQAVEVISDAFPDKTFHGRLTEISPAAMADRQNVRTFKTEVLVTDAKGFLRPGMSAEIEIVTTVRKNVLTIPTQALMEEGKKMYVYVVDKGVVKKRSVKVGEKSWEKAEITSGLRQGALVVTTVDTKGLKDGLKVTVKKEKPGDKKDAKKNGSVKANSEAGD